MTTSERQEKWASLGKGATSSEPEVLPDFGLGQYTPLNTSIGDSRAVLPQSVAKSLFTKASNELNVHDSASLMRYWQSREDANNAVSDEQLQPETMDIVKAWHAAHPAPEPKPALSDGVPTYSGDAAPQEQERVAKWQAMSKSSGTAADGSSGDVNPQDMDGSAKANDADGRVAKWKALKKPPPQ